MADRATVDVPSPLGGWGSPWPNVAEIEAALPHEKWTLVGGLMTQLHGINAGIGVVRPTNDVDIVLHVFAKRNWHTPTALAWPSISTRSPDAAALRRKGLLGDQNHPTVDATFPAISPCRRSTVTPFVNGSSLGSVSRFGDTTASSQPFRLGSVKSTDLPR